MEHLEQATRLLEQARSLGLKVVTAESCTGGLIAATFTEIAGSSDVLERGFVTYSNEAKSELLQVPPGLIDSDGAVSERVARKMAEGALENSRADVAVAVTGVAGPGGGSEDKPVGLVHIACARSGQATTHLRCLFTGSDRHDVRNRTVAAALDLIEQQLSTPSLA